MSITPQGKSVQAMYVDFRKGKLIVNRRYQRKLVWTIDEKQNLIDSILHDYPVPLVLLAELKSGEHKGKLEIIDGMQRLNAIFSFIEQKFPLLNGKRFDIKHFLTAQQATNTGLFQQVYEGEFLSSEECANILNYQLAITVYPANSELEITEVFGRINAQGRQLSSQEKRQAGVSNRVSSLVRKLASDIRGDVSTEILDLADMPAISVEVEKEGHGYGISADDTIWCKQGILSRRQLRDSEDEQMILDIIASIVLGKPINASRETFDAFYNREHQDSSTLENALASYGEEKLRQEVLGTFSVLNTMIEQASSEENFLRTIFRPDTRNPVKQPFFALFMALFNFVVVQKMSPDRPIDLFNGLKNIGKSLTNASHYQTTEDRVRNVNTVKGRIQDFFVNKIPSAFASGPGMLIEVDNVLRRSRIESSQYEVKQGLLALDGARNLNPKLVERLIETACAIANSGNYGEIILGVADKKNDADRVKELDKVEAASVSPSDRYVVGVEREARILNIPLDEYVKRIVDYFRKSQLSEHLKMDVIGKIDPIEFRGRFIIRIGIPCQRFLSFVGEKCFVREGSETVEVRGPKIAILQNRFSK